METRDEANAQTMTFWLSHDAPYVIKLTLIGPRGNVGAWEML